MALLNEEDIVLFVLNKLIRTETKRGFLAKKKQIKDYLVFLRKEHGIPAGIILSELAEKIIKTRDAVRFIQKSISPAGRIYPDKLIKNLKKETRLENTIIKWSVKYLEQQPQRMQSKKLISLPCLYLERGGVPMYHEHKKSI
jgi:hypothetical protein